MIATWTSQRVLRFYLAGGALVIGFTSAELLIRQTSFASVTIIYSIILAALVGIGKLATP